MILIQFLKKLYYFITLISQQELLLEVQTHQREGGVFVSVGGVGIEPTRI